MPVWGGRRRTSCATHINMCQKQVGVEKHVIWCGELEVLMFSVFSVLCLHFWRRVWWVVLGNTLANLTKKQVNPQLVVINQPSWIMRTHQILSYSKPVQIYLLYTLVRGGSVGYSPIPKVAGKLWTVEHRGCFNPCLCLAAISLRWPRKEHLMFQHRMG